MSKANRKEDHNKIQHLLHLGFTNYITQLIILLLATFVLFSGDIEVVLIPHSVHPVIIWMRNVCFVIFSIEIVVALSVEHNYVKSIYFVMDVIDLISLATEVSFIWDSFLEVLDNLSK